MNGATFGAADLAPPARPSVRGWMVLGVSLALMLSDYMSRQVLVAVYPQLKAEWSLSDTQLGALVGVVSLMVGTFSLPLSLVADRIGRARSVAAMAVIWSVATLACGLSADYGQMMAARTVLGLGEAAYGSVGIAVVFTFFPPTMRSSITATFIASSVFGSFFGMALGGLLPHHIGWRGTFAAMAGIGLVLAMAYIFVAREPSRPAATVEENDGVLSSLTPRAVLAGLLGSPRLMLTYVASGLQLFVAGAFMAWGPSYLNRAYGLAPQAAAVTAASLLLGCGVGMIVCGGLTDRLTACRPNLLALVAAGYGLITFLLLEAAFALPHGPLQAACAVLGLFFACGTAGPAGALVAENAPPALLAAALALLTLGNNLVGLAPAAVVTGVLADHLGLPSALRLVPFAALAAAAAFGLIWRLAQAPPAVTCGVDAETTGSAAGKPDQPARTNLPTAVPAD